MEITPAPGSTAPAIWGRIVKPDQGNLPPELARAILRLDFDAGDHARVTALSEKARAGTLDADERAELEAFLRVNSELMVLQSKARLSLKRAGPTPG